MAGNNYISGDIEGLERRQQRSSEAPRSYPVKSIHEYLKGDLYFEDFCEQSKAESRKKIDGFAEGIDEIKDIYARQLKNQTMNGQTPMIARSRIGKGFQLGVIDYIDGAIIRTQDGWVDDTGEVRLKAGESLINVAKFIKSKVDIVHDFTTESLESAEKSGILRSGFSTVAELIDVGGEMKWRDKKSQKLFDHGDLIRLLHHRDEPCIIYTSKLNNAYYHGCISQDEKPLNELPVRKGMSMQGDAVYGTASLDEAVKIYANPFSFESRGKLLSLKENEGIDDSTYDKSHIFSMSTIAKIYNATTETRAITFNDIPSLPMVLALASENKINKTFAANKWIDMKNSSSTFEVYQHMTELGTAYSNGKRNVLETLVRSMGFEGIEIQIPKNEIEDYKTQFETLLRKDDVRFEEYGVKKDEVIKQLKKYIEDMSKAIPAKADVAHLIVFDEKKVTREHLATLPMAVKVSYGEDDPDDLYHSKEPITLPMISKTIARDVKEQRFDISY
jgi:hypothetical protein